MALKTPSGMPKGLGKINFGLVLGLGNVLNDMMDKYKKTYFDSKKY